MKYIKTYENYSVGDYVICTEDIINRGVVFIKKNTPYQILKINRYGYTFSIKIYDEDGHGTDCNIQMDHKLFKRISDEEVEMYRDTNKYNL